MARTSYRESEAEDAGIKAAHAYAEKERKSRLSWQEMIVEGLQHEEARLARELEKMRTVASRIPDQEFVLTAHRAKLAKFKEAHGL